MVLKKKALYLQLNGKISFTTDKSVHNITPVPSHCMRQTGVICLTNYKKNTTMKPKLLFSLFAIA